MTRVIAILLGVLVIGCGMSTAGEEGAELVQIDEIEASRSRCVKFVATEGVMACEEPALSCHVLEPGERLAVCWNGTGEPIVSDSLRFSKCGTSDACRIEGPCEKLTCD